MQTLRDRRLIGYSQINRRFYYKPEEVKRLIPLIGTLYPVSYTHLTLSRCAASRVVSNLSGDAAFLSPEAARTCAAISAICSVNDRKAEPVSYTHLALPSCR